METSKLIAERRKTHGDYATHAGCAQSLKYYLKYWLNAAGKGDIGLTPIQQEALDMICHKIGRIIAGDEGFRDHWDDIAGYAKLVADRCDH